MSFPYVRRALTLLGGALVSTLAVSAALPLSTAQAAGPAPVAALGGTAYGSYVKVGTVVKSDRTAIASGCVTAPGYLKENRAASIDVAGISKVGATTTKFQTTGSGSQTNSIASSTTGAVNLLGGVITANAVSSTAKISRDGDDFTNSGSSTITGLKILGLPVTVSSKPNTIIKVAGIATVTTNYQTSKTVTGNHTQIVNAMKVSLLSNNKLGLPTGTIIIGSSTATLHDAVNRRTYASAYGTQIDVAGVLESGPTASVGLPCGGGNGTAVTNSTVATDLGLIGSVGAIRSTANSVDSASSTTATATSEVGGASLLDGLITVDAITTKASATKSSTKVTGSSEGTVVTGLKIAGEPVTVAATENSTIDVAGVGTLYLRRAVRSTTGIQVYALQLKLDTDQLGLVSGTTISIGQAKAGVYAS